MVQRSSLGAAAVCAVLAVMLAACTSDGVKTQDPTEPVASTSPSTSAAPSSVTPLPTPTVVPVAQDAVNAYVGLLQVLAIADQDPTRFSAAQVAEYAEPDAAADFASSFQQMAQKGLAYRGQPDNPRLTVVGPDSETSIILTSCPQPDASDPSVQYFVKTGKTVSPPTPTGPVYQRLIRMVKTDGVWKLEQLRSDTSKVCPA